MKALQKLGFLLSKKGGKGDHWKLVWPKNGKALTIHADLRKDVLDYVLDEIEKISKIKWEEIKKEL